MRNNSIYAYLKCIVLYPRIGFAIVGWIRVRIVAQHGEHGRQIGHVANHIVRYVPHPFGECLEINGLDDLVGGAFNSDVEREREPN